MNDITYYKFLDAKGGLLTLKHASLKFTRADCFNDPFDLRIDEIFGLDPPDLTQSYREAFIQFLGNNQVTNHNQLNVIKNMVNKDPEAKNEVINELSSIRDNTICIEESISQLKKQIRRLTQRCGVLCLSSLKDNIIMWSHYADHHKGIVLGFKPCFEKDSVLTLLKPVVYSSIRPIFYKNGSELLKATITNNQEKEIKSKIEELIYTKSTEWAYEKECRIEIPDAVKNDETYYMHKFHGEELSEINLGYRLEEKEKYIALAKSINPEVKIFQTELATREFRLRFQLI